MEPINPFTVICISAILVGLSPLFLVILQIGITILANKAKAERESRILAHREAEAMRRAELQEMRIAKQNNDVVIQDAKLELLALKIRDEKQKLKGYDNPDFTPTDFTPK